MGGGLESFDDANLDGLWTPQAAIEDRLFRQRTAHVPPDLFLEEVTRSYLEGPDNALAAFGYPRDGKRGKRQIVLGLLGDGHGSPLSIEVFAGHTPDPPPFTSQVKKAAERLGAVEVCR
jgi:transposase